LKYPLQSVRQFHSFPAFALEVQRDVGESENSSGKPPYCLYQKLSDSMSIIDSDRIERPALHFGTRYLALIVTTTERPPFFLPPSAVRLSTQTKSDAMLFGLKDQYLCCAFFNLFEHGNR
jgi:hypothetical protein